MDQALEMAGVLVGSCEQLAAALENLRGFKDLERYWIEIHRLENDGDRLYRDAVASLFAHGIDPMVVIRWKDIFLRLERADRRDRDRRAHPRGNRHQERVRLPDRSARGRDVGDVIAEADLILALVVATALAFDFTNGFHDTANVVATSISTRAVSPRIAIPMAAVLNFVGAFISLAVAATVAEDVVEALAITPTVVFAGLVGAIAWNLITWCFGLPRRARTR